MSVSMLPKRRSINDVFLGKCDNEVVLIDFVPASAGAQFDLTFEETQSDWRQGVWLGANGIIKVAGAASASMQIWSDNAPATTRIKIDEVNGGLFLYNIWGRGHGPQSQAHTSGMLIEEIENGWRYSCQSINLNPVFDDIRFRLERVR